MLKLYICDLAAYNSGHLVGQLVQLPMKSYQLQDTLLDIFAEGEELTGDDNHEEYIVAGYEWEDTKLFGIDEHQNICRLNLQLQKLEDKYHDKLKEISQVQIINAIFQKISEAGVNRS